MIDWEDIDTVMLDMDGTLLDLHFDNHFWMKYIPQAYAQKHRISEHDANLHLHDRFNADRGTLDWYCLDYWSAQLGMDIAALKREMRHMIVARPFALDFLARLRESGRHMIMVTNAHPTTLEIKMDQIDIIDFFDHIVVSHDLAAPKEDLAFWQKLQAIHPFDPAHTLLIDDTETVLEAASAYGIKHLLTLLQPDSQQQKRMDCRFPGIHHFDEIMPQEQNR